MRALGDERSRELVARFVDAWNRADVSAIVAMLSDDASFSMPPLLTWFRGKDDIAAFITARVIAKRMTEFATDEMTGHRIGTGPDRAEQNETYVSAP